MMSECAVPLHERMDHVVDKLEIAESRRVLVVDGDNVVGLITPRDLTRWLHRVQELHLPPGSE